MMRAATRRKFWSCGIALICALWFCPAGRGQQVPPVSFDPSAPPAKFLSELHFFKDAATQTPNDGVLPYDLNSPPFSDYSTKHRFVYLPEGTSAQYHADDVFDFPVGAVLIKTFGYLHDIRDASKGELIIETRLLVHRVEGWEGLPYLWNEDVTEATLKVAGGRIDVEWTHYDGERLTNNYLIPNMNQCKSCHEQSGALEPIGPKARNINRDYAYSHGTKNQIAHWASIGYLSGAPGPIDAPRLPVWNDPATGSLQQRARAWLEINCMHCHNPNGAGNTTGFDLSYDQHDPLKYGFMKPPVAAGLGSGNLHFDIVPGKPEESILMYRIESTDPGVMMPELPRRLADEEGNALVREWIRSLHPARLDLKDGD